MTRAAVLLIAVATLVRLGWAAALPASTDEAYHWQYTLHPALSYFDHPPMTMLVAKAGIALCGGWVHPFSLRLGFVLLCAGTSWFLFKWTAHCFGDRAGVWAVLGFSLSHYLTAFGGPFALPDSPLFFFAVLTWWQISRIVSLRVPPSPGGRGVRGEGDSSHLPPLRGGRRAAAGGESSTSNTESPLPVASQPTSPQRGEVFQTAPGGVNTVSIHSTSPLPALPPGKGGTSKVGSWLLVGIGFGGAMLSKYHGILLPAGVVMYAIVTPGARRLLWSPGPYPAVLVGLTLFSPVLYWNATHDWASFKFQGGRMGGGGSPLAHGGPLVWLVGPLVFLLPWMWFWLTLELGRRVVRFGRAVGVERLLVCLSAVPLTFFLANSVLTGRVLPHWPLLGFLPLFPLAGARWASLRLRDPRAAWWMAICWGAAELAILAAILVQVKTGVIPVPSGFIDETRAFSGWESVVEKLEERGIPPEPGAFLVTNSWDDSAQLAFVLRGRVPVACFHSFDARGFAFWSRPDDYLGRTGYMVLVDQPDEADIFRQFSYFFTTMTKCDEFPMTRGGVPFRTVRVYRCETQLLPYPFDYRTRDK